MSIEQGVTQTGGTTSHTEFPKIPGFDKGFEMNRDGLPAGIIGLAALLIVLMRPRKHD